MSLPEDVFVDEEPLGPAISENISTLVNKAASSKANLKELMLKHPRPANCEKLVVPRVNSEIFNIISNPAKGRDSLLKDAQKNLISGIVPIIKLAELFKEKKVTPASAKTLLAESLSTLAFTAYDLSLKRRFLLRPELNKKYFAICGSETPVTKQLFGDDLTAAVKSIGEAAKVSNSGLGRYQRGRGSYQNYGRGFLGGQRWPRGRRQYGNGSRYPRRGQSYQRGSWGGRGRGRGRGQYQYQTGATGQSTQDTTQ
jgi:hypothetical protein